MGVSTDMGTGGGHAPHEEPSSREILELFRSTLPDDILTGLIELELDREDLLGALYAECIEAGLDPDEEFAKKGITDE